MVKRMKNKMGLGLKISIVMLIGSLVAMVFLLNYSKDIQQGKVNSFHKTTTSISDITVDELPPQNVDGNDKITAKPFKASLADILYGKELYGNYKHETFYSGAKFNFNCTKMNEDICVSGSAIINIGTAILPLYSYDKEEDNYLNHLEDYYIIFTDKNIILTSNYAGKVPGVIKIYDLNGNKISDISNIITGYIINNNLENQLYPTLINNELKYYSCINNQVYKNGVNIDNPGALLLNEKVVGVKCY